MSDSGGRDAFNDAARASIRRRLLHHMSEHRIGVIRLADRISKANTRNPEIPIKTLQRFLAGNFRTTDMYVGFFQQFAENLPEPDPIGELGKAMATFLNAKDSESYGGDFASEMSGGSGADHINYQSALTVTPDRNFCRVVERSKPTRLIVCDGVLVGQGQTAVIALQDRTTKAPRQYLISSERGGYTAKGTEAIFRPGSGDVVRALSGWIMPPERVATAANTFGPAVVEVERARGSGLRVRRVVLPTRRRRLLEKLSGAFRRMTAEQLPAENTAQSGLPEANDDHYQF
jgi:hypothetical protein